MRAPKTTANGQNKHATCQLSHGTIAAMMCRIEPTQQLVKSVTVSYEAARTRERKKFPQVRKHVLRMYHVGHEPYTGAQSPQHHCCGTIMQHRFDPTESRLKRGTFSLSSLDFLSTSRTLLLFRRTAVPLTTAFSESTTMELKAGAPVRNESKPKISPECISWNTTRSIAFPLSSTFDTCSCVRARVRLRSLLAIDACKQAGPKNNQF